MRIVKFWVLLTGVFLMQCAEDTPNVFSLNEQLAVHEVQLVSLELEDVDKRIDLQVIEINESRCPSDVVCIRYGEAKVKVGVNGNEEILKTVDLCIGDCPERTGGFIEADTVQVQLDGEDYAVILSGVTPYPTTTNQSIPKQALLQVIRW